LKAKDEWGQLTTNDERSKKIAQYAMMSALLELVSSPTNVLVAVDQGMLAFQQALKARERHSAI
jgi:hypothetical protein